jgi:hypothetical protein
MCAFTSMQERHNKGMQFSHVERRQMFKGNTRAKQHDKHLEGCIQQWTWDNVDRQAVAPSARKHVTKMLTRCLEQTWA